MNKRARAVAAVAVLSVGAGTTTVALGGEVAPGGTMHVAPTEVEPGGSYVISNDPASPCFLGEVSGDTGGVRPGAWFVEPDGSGNWSVTIEVPASGPPDAMGNPTPFPEGVYEQHARCAQPDVVDAARAAQQAEFDYGPVDVTVVAPEDPAPTPTPSTPPAAQPEAAAPSFTG